MKIYKKKVKNPSFFERMRKKAAKGFNLDYRFTFGKYIDCILRYTIDVDPVYVDKMVRDNILSLDKDALIYLTIAMQRKRKTEQAESERQRRAEERRRETYYGGYSNGDEDFNAFCDQFFGGHARQDNPFNRINQRNTVVVPENVHPAHRFDNLPEKVRYGKILRLQGEVTKENIRVQYRRLAMQFHPDKSATMDEEFQKFANEWFLQIKKAYEWFKVRYDL